MTRGSWQRLKLKLLQVVVTGQQGRNDPWLVAEIETGRVQIVTPNYALVGMTRGSWQRLKHTTTVATVATLLQLQYWNDWSLEAEIETG